ncbi:MAG: bifunctional 5,10-methylene-tetrahydrofolate dehydrogenase/5,10-methylene-tetrahydrofolate cyclohydrolase [Bacteroidetes bacterium]|nr:bifunctional 5,10-methylene-tetrahydrofolate dehydrogenase/5,10-methylene-tetrahydrofolate cyclohydrolase [Bacteroidota bacterium]
MSASIIDGKQIASEIKDEIRDDVARLRARGIVPKLVAVLVGENPASQVYVRNKGIACRDVGMDHETINLPSETTQGALLSLIEKLNVDQSTSGILVQLPLPKHINENSIIHAINPAKDVDCFHPSNVGRISTGDPLFLPCTPAGCQELLLRSGNDPAGKHVVIVGRSNIVGKPLANMLIQKTNGANATVTICHTGTRDVAFFTKQADIVVAAAGKAEVITGDMLKSGCAVIDVGINRLKDESKKSGYRLVGDVHFESAKDVAGAITPVPGGVGPMTIVMLLKNTMKAAQI